MSLPSLPLHPFQNIAVGLSGGGFRAASYSLGNLSYLEHIKYDRTKGISLLDNVNFISSASGGTITAALYSAGRHKGQNFIDCYRKLLKTVLPGDDLLNSVLEKLNDDKEWDTPGNTKRRNIINSFARVYDEKIFDGDCLGVFRRQEKPEGLEVCFNSTEFTRGFSFRFQANGTGKAGNSFVFFGKDENEAFDKIKLGDVLAASSCFPGGFEPIAFPEDFAYKNEKTQLTSKSLREHVILKEYSGAENLLRETESIGLMDGGINDNQGLDSAILADMRRRNNKDPRPPFDLIFITDVTSYFMDPYKVPGEKENKGWRTNTIELVLGNIKKGLKKLNLLTTITLLIFLAAATGIFLCSDILGKNISLVLTGLSAAFLIVRILIWWFVFRKNKILLSFIKSPDEADINEIIKEKLPSINKFSPEIVNKLLGYFKNTRLGVLEQMILARVNSVVTMASDVFLKHIRRKIFDHFYQDIRWENRRANNFVYELSPSNLVFREKLLKEKPWADQETIDILSPNKNLADIAFEARNMGTTLWFDENDTKAEKLKQLVTCGQFTCCVNLLQYCIDLKYKIENKLLTLAEDDRPVLTSIHEQVENDWKKFKTDPYFLYKKYEEELKAV